MVIYSQQNSPVNFVEMINKLNINYQSSSNYNLVYKDKFFKINNQILNPSYKEFILRQNLVYDEVWVEYNEFVLNGNNFFVKFTNKSNKEKKLSLELNIPLKKGYYYFKKATLSAGIFVGAFIFLAIPVSIIRSIVIRPNAIEQKEVSSETSNNNSEVSLLKF